MTTLQSSSYSRWCLRDTRSVRRTGRPTSEPRPSPSSGAAPKDPTGRRRYRNPGCRRWRAGSSGCGRRSTRPQAADSRPSRPSSSCSRWNFQDTTWICRTCCYGAGASPRSSPSRAAEPKDLMGRRRWRPPGYKRCRVDSSARGRRSKLPEVTDNTPTLRPAFCSRYFRRRRTQSRYRELIHLCSLSRRR